MLSLHFDKQEKSKVKQLEYRGNALEVGDQKEQSKVDHKLQAMVEVFGKEKLDNMTPAELYQNYKNFNLSDRRANAL